MKMSSMRMDYSTPFIAALAALATGAGSAAAQTISTWQTGGSNVWSVDEPGNWTDGVPNQAGDVAYITADITETTAISITSPITVGTLHIGDSAGSPRNVYNITPGTGGSLTFKASDGGNAVLRQTASPSNPNNTIGAFTLESSLEITNASTSQFTLNGAISGTGDIIITSENVGRVYMTAASSFVGNLTLNAGTLLTGAQGNALFGSTDPATGNRVITINNNATLQLNNNLSLGANRRLVVGTGGATLHLNNRTFTIGVEDQLSGSTPLLVTNAGSVIVNTTNSNFTGTLSIATTTTAAASLTLNAPDALGGDIRVGLPATLIIGSDGSIAAGRTVTLLGGTLDTSAKSTYTVAAGQAIAGSGNWLGASESNTILGTLSVGATHGAVGTPELLNITNGTLALGGVVEFDLFSASAADALTAEAVQYGGTLRVANPTGIALEEGLEWDLFDATRSGLTTFTNSFAHDDPNLPTLPGYLKWAFDYDSGVLRITQVPEPATFGTLALLGGAVLVRRRRNG